MPSTKLSKVDELILEVQEHYYLDRNDTCFYIGEYTARRGYSYSDTNGLIFNLKKSPKHRGTTQWYWKEKAIRTAARMLRTVLDTDRNRDWLCRSTLVPIPPSKCRDDPLYDDRILSVLQLLNPELDLDIRELVIQRESMEAAHESESRPLPGDIAENYKIDEDLVEPAPVRLAVFDDLLTTGGHFKAMQAVLEERFPGVPVTGIFLDRGARPSFAATP